MIATDYIFGRNKAGEQPGTIDCLCDYYPTIGAGWFPFRIKRDFSKCLRLIRSSDQAETDVFADNDPNIKISLNSEVSAGGTLGAWIGGDDAHVLKAYDMTGNGFDFTYVDDLPKFITAGQIITTPDTGEVAIHATTDRSIMRSPTGFPITGDIPFSVFTKEKFESYGNQISIVRIGVPFPNTDRRVALIAPDSSSAMSFRYYGGYNAYSTSNPTTTHLVSGFKDPSQAAVLFQNGVQQTLTGTGSNNLNIQPETNFTLFAGAQDRTTEPGATGYLCGLIWYLSNQIANREQIENLIT